MLVGGWGVGVPAARVEFRAEGRRVDARADEHELGTADGSAVAGAGGLGGGPGLRVEAQEAPDGVDGVPVPRVVGAEVDVPLDPVEALGPAVQEAHEPARVEREAGHEGQGVVGGVQVSGVRPALGVVVQVVEGQLPHAFLAGPAVVEELGVDTAVGGRDDGGTVGERVHEGEHPLGVGGPVGLVDHDQVGEGQVPVDLGVPGTGVVELGGVDDLDEPAVDDPRLLGGEQHAHQFLRFGESAGLDDDDVDAGLGAGQPFQVPVEFARVDGTAQASVAQRHGGVAEGARDGHRVDLDGPEVVDDGADTAASAAVEEVVEEGGFPGAEESGEYDDRDLLRSRALPHRATSLSPTRTPARGSAYVHVRNCLLRIRAGAVPAE